MAHVDAPRPLVDGFGRAVTYLRLSVTDRCDLRCFYCMAERPDFVPKRDLLSLEEMQRLVTTFIRRGVRKLRITGGEPLVRRGVVDLMHEIGRHLVSGALDELTLTTNGTQLAHHAEALVRAGVRRVNVSLDSLCATRFAAITRGGRIADTLDGIAAARAAGLAVKINTVVLGGVNDDELDVLVAFAHRQDMDLTFIEVMPIGEEGYGRSDRFLPLDQVREKLGQRWSLVPSLHRSGGPARYWQVAETGRRLGFIAATSCNFCAACNRVRITATGRLETCLGHEAGVDLRAPLRLDPTGRAIEAAIDAAIAAKPAGHAFAEAWQRPATARGMHVTGG
ncbi:GTP 3',8-cyclase MoaA [Phreatobacter cathodiphilus]|uniref:GTP 3',8-cyclase n=1 Tax=Phreatobacter cathodiphilus TaxID=1868589 RepID=A0A2S0NE11_9HYPH|nr:GTP 3',8-cyclase MoaA [Phreatobacter cathodiphilus]AVO46409.1 GTP 3',8-cyclase MoaA [Phreatobacter cathodiphilus]